MCKVLASTAAVLIILAGLSAQAQCPVQEDDNVPPSVAIPGVAPAAGDEQLLPESAYLSDHSYTNVFFGFGLVLPLEAQGHLLMLPLMPPKQHALLALEFEKGSRRGSVLITASEPANEQYKMTDQEKNEEIQRWTQNKPSLRQEMPDWMMRSGHMYHTEKRSGEERTLQYTTRIKNYVVRVKIDSNDSDFGKAAKRSVEMMQFYCPETDGTITTPKGDVVTPQGKPYSGPTVPTWRVDARLAEKPEEHAIAIGSVSDGVYGNPELGLRYDLPAGWQVDPAQVGLQQAVDPTRQRIRDYLNACSETLVHATGGKSNTSADQAAQGEIVLRALDPACLSLRGPDSMGDQQGAEELAAYLEMLGEFGEIQSSELVSASGRVFAIYRGMVGQRGAGEELPSRASQMIVVTRYNKLLLLWSLIVPKGAEWKSFPQSRVSFGGEAPIVIGPALWEKR